MLSKNDIKDIRALSQKKFREERGLFVVEGEKMVEEAISSGFGIEAIYRQDEIGREAMERISLLSSPSPVLAVVRRKPSSKAPESVRGLVLALDSVRDPGNLGTIIRIADWFGVDTILASEDTVELYNPKTVQATMGAIFRVNVIYCDLPKTLDAIRANGTPVYGTFLEGSDIYGEALEANAVMVMGSESNGISDAVKSVVDKKLLIPPFPRETRRSESLNVAVATAICVSEFRRRSL